MEISEHQILLSEAVAAAYNRGLEEGRTLKRARMTILLDEAFMSGIRAGLSQGRRQAFAELASGLPVENGPCSPPN